MTNQAADTDSAFSACTKITEPLKDAILSHNSVYSYEMLAGQLTAKSKIQQLRRQQSHQQAETLMQNLPDALKRAFDLTFEKGTSSWLTTLPIEEFGLTLHKGAFYDALALRYGWHPTPPLNCSCGSTFSVEHALSCTRGGFPII